MSILMTTINEDISSFVLVKDYPQTRIATYHKVLVRY